MIILFVFQVKLVDGIDDLSTGFSQAPLGSLIVVKLAVGVRSSCNVTWWWHHHTSSSWWWQISGHHLIPQSGTDRQNSDTLTTN